MLLVSQKPSPLPRTMLKIVVADDHPIVREGLKLIIAKTADMMVAGEASDGQELLTRLRTTPADIVLLDITMPGRSGLDVLKQIKTQYPKIRLLVLSHHPEDQYALRVLRAGAAGYLTKESASEQLITAIRKVASGGKYVSLSLAEQLAAELDAPADKPLHGTLSDREYEVMRMIAIGKSVSEIAEELALSVKTISTYRTRILAKMNMTRTADIIHYGIRHGLIDDAAKSAEPRKSRGKS
jgi:two-component system, NarL family, invasion response regulator UvrY